MDKYKDIDIKFFNIKSITPNSKIVVIGKPGTGKTTLITDILYNFKDTIPVGIVFSGTEESNDYYSSIFPPLFVYNEFEPNVLGSIKRRQILTKKSSNNSYMSIIIDDCTADEKVFHKKEVKDLCKNSRHWDTLSIFGLQYCIDLKPAIRNCLDYIFIFREKNIRTRKLLFENYGGIADTFKNFSHILDMCTENFECLVVNNKARTNNLEDCLFYYKANLHPKFKFGCKEYWNWNNVRYSKNKELII